MIFHCDRVAKRTSIFSPLTHWMQMLQGLHVAQKTGITFHACLLMDIVQKPLPEFQITLHELCALMASFCHHPSLQPKRQVYVIHPSSQIFSWHDCRVIWIVGVKNRQRYLSIWYNLEKWYTANLWPALIAHFILNNFRSDRTLTGNWV